MKNIRFLYFCPQPQYNMNFYSQETPNQQLGHGFGVVEGVAGVLGF